MLTRYEEIDPLLIERQGKSYIACDAEGCQKEAVVENIVEHQLNNGVLLEGDLPEGWATSDPDNNPMRGAADYCPDHADKIVVLDDTPEQA